MLVKEVTWNKMTTVKCNLMLISKPIFKKIYWPYNARANKFQQDYKIVIARQRIFMAYYSWHPLLNWILSGTNKNQSVPGLQFTLSEMCACSKDWATRGQIWPRFVFVRKKTLFLWCTEWNYNMVVCPEILKIDIISTGRPMRCIL